MVKSKEEILICPKCHEEIKLSDARGLNALTYPTTDLISINNNL